MAGGRFRLSQNFQLRRRAPQPLQIIIMPRLLAEDVHDEAAKIQQRPFRRTASFAVLWRAPLPLIQLLLDLRANRLHLRRAESRANHEVGSKRSHSAEIEDRNSRRFLVLRRLDCEAHALW